MHFIHIVCLLKENSQQQLRSANLAQWIALLLSSERALDWSLVMAGFQFVFLFFHFCSYRKLLLIVKIHSKPKAVYKHFVQHIGISVWRIINTIVFIWQKTCSNIYTHIHYLFFWKLFTSGNISRKAFAPFFKNRLIPKSDQRLISPYNITLESF